ncbi:MAG: tol-pal system YbgF family protein, partial [Vampirovibrionia bacterium]
KTLSRVGTIYCELGETELALKYYKQELLIAKKVIDPYWIAMAYLDLGDLHYFMEEFIKAAKYFFISKKVIRKSISTDSKEKIERRLLKLQDYIPQNQFNQIKEQIMSKQ